MPNLTPSDVHVMVPVGTEVKSRARTGDSDWESRKKQRKKKVKEPDYTPDGVNKMRVQKKFHSAANRRKLASQGKALSNDSYPIEDPEDLKNAATLARSGHGDVAAAKRLISRRAKQLGVGNPLTASSPVGKASAGLVPLSFHFSRLTR